VGEIRPFNQDINDDAEERAIGDLLFFVLCFGPGEAKQGPRMAKS